MPAERFLTDSSLDELARRLRFLGYDIVTIPGARLEELFEAARRDQRTVLTLSTRYPKKFKDVPVRVIPRGDAVVALRTVTETTVPVGEPFSRCPRCNCALQRRHPLEATGEVPGRVLRRARSLQYCPICGKWYWDGSHVERLRRWLEQALGRPVAGPPGVEPDES